MRWRTVVVLAAALLASCDTVEASYETLAQARQDNLFSRGWLPDVLPTSTRNLHVRTDLDLNSASGSFTFDSSDAESFFRMLKPIEASSPMRPEWQLFAAAFQGHGYGRYMLADGNNQWLFICKDGDVNCKNCWWLLHNDG